MSPVVETNMAGTTSFFIPPSSLLQQLLLGQQRTSLYSQLCPGDTVQRGLRQVIQGTSSANLCPWLGGFLRYQAIVSCKWLLDSVFQCWLWDFMPVPQFSVHSPESLHSEQGHTTTWIWVAKPYFKSMCFCLNCSVSADLRSEFLV